MRSKVIYADRVRNDTSFAEIEKMPSELRELVFEYGYQVVNACLHAGVSKPARIHALVTSIWNGPRSNLQKRDSTSVLDWYLLQVGAEITAIQLIRLLKMQGLIVIPATATSAMINASMDEVSGFNVICTKREKHKRRLDAALKAGADYLERADR